MGEAARRREAIRRGEPDPLPQNVGVRLPPVVVRGRWLSSWMTNRAARRRIGIEGEMPKRP